MNDQFQISTVNFKMYPILTKQQWATIKIGGWGYFLIALLIGNFMVYSHKYWKSVTKKQPTYIEVRYPMLIREIPFVAGGIASEKEVDMISGAYVDEYTFKNHVFKNYTPF
jgi:hypothetical protein